MIFLALDMLVRGLGDGHSHDRRGGPAVVVTGLKKIDSDVTDPPELKRKFMSSVLLNLTANALHNFTDGLAIGASFASQHLDYSHDDPFSI